MGHSSKKKKKRGGVGGRRAPSKDHNSFGADNSELITEELTALYVNSFLHVFRKCVFSLCVFSFWWHRANLCDTSSMNV